MTRNANRSRTARRQETGVASKEWMVVVGLGECWETGNPVAPAGLNSEPVVFAPVSNEPSRVFPPKVVRRAVHAFEQKR